MRRPLAIYFYLLVLIPLLMACNGGYTSSNNGINEPGYGTNCMHTNSREPAAPEYGPVTLTVTGLSTSPTQDNLLTEQITNFQKIHPNIRIKWSLINNDYATFIQAAIANGNAPDVFYLQPGMADSYLNAGKLLNLKPYMNRDQVSSSNYYTALINTFSCANGQVYGIPDGWNTLGIFYNKQKFQAAHMTEPSDNWIWNDMLTTAKKMTWIGETPEYGVILPADASHWLAFLLANGGSVLTPDGKQAAFNSEAGIQALNFYLSFERLDHSAVLPSEVSSDWNGNVPAAFGEQRASMVLENSKLIPYMQQSHPDITYGIAPLPLAPSGRRATPIFTNAWAAYSRTQHANAAWTFIQYMTRSEVQRTMLQAGVALPSLPSLANDPYFTTRPNMKLLLHAATYGYIDNFGPNDTFIHDRLNLAISSVLFGNADAKTALDNAAQQVNQQLAT